MTIPLETIPTIDHGSALITEDIVFGIKEYIKKIDILRVRAIHNPALRPTGYTSKEWIDRCKKRISILTDMLIYYKEQLKEESY